MSAEIGRRDDQQVTPATAGQKNDNLYVLTGQICQWRKDGTAGAAQD